MKRIIPALIVALALAGCVSKRTADRLTNDRDSLSVVVAEKDSVINDVFASLNQISENLTSIKDREHIITTSVDNNEIKKESTVQINDDIQAIDQMLQQNRETIARLQRNAAELRKRIPELETLIKQLNGQVEARDSEIADLKDKLRGMDIKVEEMNTNITTLNNTVSGLSEDKTRLEGEVKDNTDRLNKAYYIVGPVKELLAKEIIYKSGFIGRTLRVNGSHSLDAFTQVDARNFDEVVIGHKDVTVVSTHPADSYQLVTDDKGMVTSLTIKDKTQFWSLSKVLVVSYK